MGILVCAEENCCCCGCIEGKPDVGVLACCERLLKGRPLGAAGGG